MNTKLLKTKLSIYVRFILNIRWNIIQPTKLFTEGSMLPLMGILEDNDYITKLNFSCAAMNDSRFQLAFR
jgi:hypothetical protein